MIAIEDLLDSVGFNSVCETCPFYKTTDEPHVYGSTVVYEPVADCVCPDDSDCKRLKGDGNERD